MGGAGDSAPAGPQAGEADEEPEKASASEGADGPDVTLEVMEDGRMMPKLNVARQERAFEAMGGLERRYPTKKPDENLRKLARCTPDPLRACSPRSSAR